MKKIETESIVTSLVACCFVVFFVIAILDVISIWLLLALYGAAVALMWMAALIMEHRNGRTHADPKLPAPRDTDPDSLSDKEIGRIGREAPLGRRLHSLPVPASHCRHFLLHDPRLGRNVDPSRN